MADSSNLGRSDLEPIVPATQPTGAAPGSVSTVGIAQPKRAARVQSKASRAEFAAAAEREWAAFPEAWHASVMAQDQSSQVGTCGGGRRNMGDARRSVNQRRRSHLSVEDPDQNQETNRACSIGRACKKGAGGFGRVGGVELDGISLRPRSALSRYPRWSQLRLSRPSQRTSADAGHGGGRVQGIGAFACQLPVAWKPVEIAIALAGVGAAFGRGGSQSGIAPLVAITSNFQRTYFYSSRGGA